MSHAIAMHGRPALPADATHLPYADPGARRGGVLRMGELGTFDSLNPFILRGVAAAGIREYIFESLLARSADEPSRSTAIWRGASIWPTTEVR